ncbi:patatin-like phospholipase family protein [Portibacter marinus]|uniref:patatin-like phospholipase family protein n=1 Tax=Portibacter marinus TaxID=2898660 RepID=UPI001F1D715C|nr:patatin-like phospholipase family protein [Portibacter marinus]
MGYPLGVVLSGGSVRGSAHVGFLKRMNELGFKPDIISGSSAGAMVGAFCAAGKTIDEMMDFFRNTSLFRYNSINPLTPGIFDTAKYESIFQNFLPPTFEELQIPLIIATTNIEKGDAEYFSSGDLYKPLLASCAIPFVFAPIEMNGYLHVDGGVLDNFPVEQLVGKCDKIIGSFLGSPGAVDRKSVSSKIKITSRANELLMYAASRLKFPLTDCTIEHPLMEFGYFDQKKMDDIYQVGYEFCLKEMKADILEPAS